MTISVDYVILKRNLCYSCFSQWCEFLFNVIKYMRTSWFIVDTPTREWLFRFAVLSTARTNMLALKRLKPPFLLLPPRHAAMHWKGEAANLLAGWLGGQRGLSHQSTAVLNENRKWFTSLMLQPSACLPAFASRSQFARHSSYREWNWDQGKRGKKEDREPQSVENCSNETWILSVPTSLTSTKFVFVI